MGLSGTLRGSRAQPVYCRYEHSISPAALVPVGDRGYRDCVGRVLAGNHDRFRALAVDAGSDLDSNWDLLGVPGLALATWVRLEEESFSSARLIRGYFATPPLALIVLKPARRTYGFYWASRTMT